MDGTAADLLDTIARLCARSCERAAISGEAEEWTGAADYTALCLSCLPGSGGLAREVMRASARIAHERVGAGRALTADQFLHALTLTADYAERVLERMPAAA